MKVKIKKVIKESEVTTSDSSLEEGIWSTIIHGLSKLGSPMPGGGKAKAAAKEKYKAVLAKESSVLIRDLQAGVEKEFPKFPNMTDNDEFVKALTVYYSFYDSIKKGVKDGKMPVAAANEIVQDLRTVVKGAMNVKLSDAYKHFKENKDITDEEIEQLMELFGLGSSAKMAKAIEDEEGRQELERERGEGEGSGAADAVETGTGYTDQESEAEKGLRSNKAPLIIAALGGALSKLGWAEFIREPMVDTFPVDKPPANPAEGKGVIVDWFEEWGLGESVPLQAKPGDGFRKLLTRLLKEKGSNLSLMGSKATHTDMIQAFKELNIPIENTSTNIGTIGLEGPEKFQSAFDMVRDAHQDPGTRLDAMFSDASPGADHGTHGHVTPKFAGDPNLDVSGRGAKEFGGAQGARYDASHASHAHAKGMRIKKPLAIGLKAGAMQVLVKTVVPVWMSVNVGMGAAAGAATIAKGGAGAAGSGVLLAKLGLAAIPAAIAVKALRMKSLKSSRAQQFMDLQAYLKPIGEGEEEEVIEDTTPEELLTGFKVGDIVLYTEVDPKAEPRDISVAQIITLPGDEGIHEELGISEKKKFDPTKLNAAERDRKARVAAGRAQRKSAAAAKEAEKAERGPMYTPSLAAQLEDPNNGWGEDAKLDSQGNSKKVYAQLQIIAVRSKDRGLSPIVEKPINTAPIFRDEGEGFKSYITKIDKVSPAVLDSFKPPNDEPLPQPDLPVEAPPSDEEGEESTAAKALKALGIDFSSGGDQGRQRGPSQAKLNRSVRKGVPLEEETLKESKTYNRWSLIAGTKKINNEKD